MSKKNYPLDNIVEAGSYYYTYGSSLFTSRVIQSLLSNPGEKVMRSIGITGTLLKTLDELHDYMKSKGGKLAIAKADHSYTYVWEDSFVDIDFNKKTKNTTITGLTCDVALAMMSEELEETFITKVKKNLVFTIVQNSAGGLDIKNMGDGSSPFIKENYLPEVVEDINFVVESFKKTPPSGRIAILNGEPGTGKTHLIRSMLQQLDCVFLIVPSNLIDSLDKPQFVPLLMNIKTEHEKPIILIIEDGDVCLVPRKNDNISTIASLLNLSDGIMGAIIDIKMIISTNAAIKDIDAAIMRPGRLCRNIHVGALSYDQANQVYKRLMNDESVNLEYQRFYTLAEIYDRFNNKDATPAATSQLTKKVIGFSNSDKSDENRIMNKIKMGFGNE